MRVVPALVVVVVAVGAGCYDPHPIPGQACADGECPDGLECVANVCERPGGGDDGDDTSGDDQPPGPVDADPASQLRVAPKIATCMAPMFPGSNQACGELFGPDRLLLTSDGGVSLGAWNIYLRFDLPVVDLEGRTIRALTFEMTVASDAGSGGVDGGELFVVDEFTQLTLGSVAPDPILSIAASPGMVGPDQRVEWTLPNVLTDLAGQSAYLGVIAGNADEVYYGSLAAAVPPALVIDFDD